MTLTEIRAMPTVYTDGQFRVHESVMRSYHMLNQVKELLKAGTPPAVIFDLIVDTMPKNSGTNETVA